LSISIGVFPASTLARVLPLFWTLYPPARTGSRGEASIVIGFLPLRTRAGSLALEHHVIRAWVRRPPLA
jgi:hypothetical protein